MKEGKKMKICIPVEENKGLESPVYGHFGSAPVFIVYNSENGELKAINNGDLNHEHGKCQPLKAIAGEEVDAVLTGGIGAGAISRLNSSGIRVFRALEGTAKQNIDSFVKNELMEFTAANSCSHHNCSH